MRLNVIAWDFTVEILGCVRDERRKKKKFDRII